jgi:hypothetical protein
MKTPAKSANKKLKTYSGTVRRKGTMGRGTEKLLAKESEFKMEKSLECQLLPLAPMPCSTMQ